MGGFNPNETSFLLDACQRADGQARHLVLTSTFMGEGINEEAFITEINLPVAFVHGIKDQGINGDYIKKLPIKNLKGFHILNTDHATFWQDNEGFNKILRDLAEDIFRK